MNKFLAEVNNLKQAWLPVDLNTAAVTGIRIKLAIGQRCALVVSMGDSTAAVASFSLKQHNAASAGTSKALSVANPYYYKKGAQTAFTKVVPASATDAYDVSAFFSDDEGVVIFEVLADQLDINNGYAWFSVDVADSTAAKIGSGVYHLCEMRQLPAYSQDI